MNKKLIVGAIVLAVIAFFIGSKTAGTTATTSVRGTNGQMSGTRFAGRVGGGFVSGNILSKDDKSLTIKLTDGSSRIVFFGSSTPIIKSVPGSVDDLTTNESVSVSGPANSDGTVNASSIQIRPAQNK